MFVNKLIRRVAALLVIVSLASVAASAQEEAAEQPDNTFGGWHFVQVHHDFKKPSFYTTLYLEHANYQYQRLDCIYGRLSLGYKPLKWLSFGVNYLPVYDTAGWKHFMEIDLVGVLKSGDLSVSIRERYRRGFTTNTNELRSRLKVAYSIPSSRFAPYLAAEVFTWGNSWLKTRHYVACTYAFTDFMQLEWYYMYYAFKDKPAENVIGLGLNFTI